MTKSDRKTDKGLFTRQNALVVSILSLVVFAASFFLPVIDLGLVQISGARAASFSFEAMVGKNEMLASLSSLASEFEDPGTNELNSSYMLAWLKFSWLSNVAFLVAITLLFLSRPMPTVAFFIAAGALVWSASGLIDFDQVGESWHNFDSFSIGYYAWTLSLLILVIACMLHPGEDARHSSA